MSSRCLLFLLVGFAPIALAACAGIEPATGSPIPTAPVVGVDLGGSGRVPQIAGLVGEGEGYGRTEPGVTSSEQHGPMSGMAHGSRDHESMPGMSHDSMSGMVHGSMDRESMPGMSGSQRQMLPAHGSMPGMDHAKHKMQMAHSGHGHVQGTGTVNSVDATAHKLNVSHGPIPTIGLPAMTMDFSVGPSIDLSAVKTGTRIKFEMEKAQDGSYVIQSIAPAGERQ